MSNEKLIERIQKLLNLSASSNANEAAAAMEKAIAMMQEHNITHGDLLMKQIDRLEIKSTQSVSRPKDWESYLMHLVAEAFGCKLLWRAGRSKNKDYWGRHIFVGPKVHLPLVEYSVTYLLRSLVKGRSEFSRVLNLQGFRRGPEMTAELDGYCKGWLYTIRPKMTAMALNIDLQEAINKYVEDTTKGRQAKNHDRGQGLIGEFAGVMDAKKIDVNRPMTEQEVRRLA